eukprot:scaffold1516_cov192-Alexandrium_tamarense.AAC.22
MSAIELLEDLIADLEAKLNLAPGADPVVTKAAIGNNSNDKKNQKTTFTKSKPSKTAPASDIPEICKLEFKVGRITKVWVHPDADKLYCEEIDCGEADGPRQIASGLRMHYEEEEMLGKRVLVVANLKVEKKKVFAACMDGMKTNDDCVGTWNGHVFMTSAGPCKGRTVKGGAMR